MAAKKNHELDVRALSAIEIATELRTITESIIEIDRLRKYLAGG